MLGRFLVLAIGNAPQRDAEHQSTDYAHAVRRRDREQADHQRILEQGVGLLGRGRRFEPLQARQARPLHVVPVQPLLKDARSYQVDGSSVSVRWWSGLR